MLVGARRKETLDAPREAAKAAPKHQPKERQRAPKNQHRQGRNFFASRQQDQSHLFSPRQGLEDLLQSLLEAVDVVLDQALLVVEMARLHQAHQCQVAVRMCTEIEEGRKVGRRRRQWVAADKGNGARWGTREGRGEEEGKGEGGEGWRVEDVAPLCSAGPASLARIFPSPTACVNTFEGERASYPYLGHVYAA